MPSLYLKNNYTSNNPTMMQSRQTSIERGVTSMSKDLNATNGRVSGQIIQNASFLLAHQLMGDKAPSTSSKRIGIGKKSLINNPKVIQSPVLSRDPSMANHNNRQSITISANASVDKLKKTFNANKAAELDKTVNQGSTRYTNDPETTVLWRDDIKLDIETQLTFTSCLGQGSFAKVYEGFDKLNKSRVAIKVIDKRKITEPKRRNLIQTEISILARMKHKNIGEFHRLIEDHKRLFIVMQLCGTMTLNHFCRQFNGKRLNEEQAYAVFSQISVGVKYMHDHDVGHRDLKLTNILIDDEYTVKIIDFGFACEAREKHKMYCGTPSYMAPEIIEKKMYYARPVDIWSLGVVLFKLLTGEYAFGGKQELMQLRMILT